METVLLITTFAALFGAYLNAKGSRYGFLIWIITNFIFAVHNYSIGQWQQGLLFSTYEVLAIWGFCKSCED